jgi:hypothetical protein
VSYWGGTLNSEASGYGKFQFGRYKDYPGGELLQYLLGTQSRHIAKNQF